jgi:ATP-dependent RNA helicase RhlE
MQNNNNNRPFTRRFGNGRNNNAPARGGFNRGGSGRRFNAKPRNTGERIPVEKFINKATINVANQEQEYKPTNNFNGFGIDQRIKTNLAQKGFNILTPIQDMSIPHILAGKDLVGIANTGTGKTLAFIVPMLNKVLRDNNQKVLIITPTRELASQIEGELYKITFQIPVRRVVCIGGANIGKQISELRRGPQFVIGTPGRLKDLAERKVLRLESFTNVVIDEVDRMFDMGFAPDIKHILALMPKSRHSLFFSATVDNKILALINENSNNPVTVRIESRDTAETIQQDIIRTTRREKFSKLHGILIQEEVKKVLIFGRTKFGVNKLTESLREKGLDAESIHGNKTQVQRQRSLKSFKTGRVNILVATDVAARGLDIPGVTHVINFELPATYADYIHRIGRTGRANMVGQAYTMIEE